VTVAQAGVVITMSGTKMAPPPQSRGAPAVKGRYRLWSIAAALSAVLAALMFVTPGSASVGRAASPRAATGTGAAVRAAAAAVTPAPCSSGTCWVAVNVATLWVQPWYPRPVDAPALANPAQPGLWVASMTVGQKLGLVGLLQTQAVYGTKVKVIGHYGTGWTKVAVPSQPAANLGPGGYPGWVPTRQLTSTAPPGAANVAWVRSRVAYVWSSWTSAGVAGSHVMRVSYNTWLAVVRATPAYVVVKLIGGRQVALSRAVVVVHPWATGWAVTGAQLAAEASKFRGLQYLWAGTSGYGYDCSGFTYSLYRAYGRTISRDADQQFAHGTPVARASLRPGDLVFFRGSPAGVIGHVGMYVGGGNMIDSPQTGVAIRTEPVSSYPYYAGARRYL
jgi:cell wall-associated NlpC family hydrolase